MSERDILVRIWWSVWIWGIFNTLGLLGVVIVIAEQHP